MENALRDELLKKYLAVYKDESRLEWPRPLDKKGSGSPPPDNNNNNNQENKEALQKFKDLIQKHLNQANVDKILSLLEKKEFKKIYPLVHPNKHVVNKKELYTEIFQYFQKWKNSIPENQKTPGGPKNPENQKNPKNPENPAEMRIENSLEERRAQTPILNRRKETAPKNKNKVKALTETGPMVPAGPNAQQSPAGPVIQAIVSSTMGNQNALRKLTEQIQKYFEGDKGKELLEKILNLNPSDGSTIRKIRAQFSPNSQAHRGKIPQATLTRLSQNFGTYVNSLKNAQKKSGTPLLLEGGPPGIPRSIEKKNIQNKYNKIKALIKENTNGNKYEEVKGLLGEIEKHKNNLENYESVEKYMQNRMPGLRSKDFQNQFKFSITKPTNILELVYEIREMMKKNNRSKNNELFNKIRRVRGLTGGLPPNIKAVENRIATNRQKKHVIGQLQQSQGKLYQARLESNVRTAQAKAINRKPKRTQANPSETQAKAINPTAKISGARRSLIQKAGNALKTAARFARR